MSKILSGNVLWSYSHEVLQRNTYNDVGYHFSGSQPYHDHTGVITLDDNVITVVGDKSLHIPLYTITQLYLGFDEVYHAGLTKNFGLFWQPLRIALSDESLIYFIIDYNFIAAKNKRWFTTLKDILQ